MESPQAAAAVANRSRRPCACSTGDGREIISYPPQTAREGRRAAASHRAAAAANIPGDDELFITGLHLEQYRHATRCPTVYWREALRRDPLDCRCNNAMGLWHLQRGEFAQAEPFSAKPSSASPAATPTPADGAAFYNLGLTLRLSGPRRRSLRRLLQGHLEPGLDGRRLSRAGRIGLRTRGDWAAALEHLDRSLRFDADNLRARNLKAMVLRATRPRRQRQIRFCAKRSGLDPLDWWARLLHGERSLAICPGPARSGARFRPRRPLPPKPFRSQGFHPRRARSARPMLGAAPLVNYTLGWLAAKPATRPRPCAWYPTGRRRPARLLFPGAPGGNRGPDRGHGAPIRGRAARPIIWAICFTTAAAMPKPSASGKSSARLDPSFLHRLAQPWHRLISTSPDNRARLAPAYDQAFAANPGDARLLFERDQLGKRLADPPARRLAELEKYPSLVRRRDDLTHGIVRALQSNRPPRKSHATSWPTRKFQPWEGGEGRAPRPACPHPLWPSDARPWRRAILPAP